MVRLASFVESERSTPRIIVENVGLSNQAKLPVPEQGTFLITMGSTSVTYEIKFSQVQFTFDSNFYSAMEAILTGTPPTNSHIHDKRVSPAVYQRIDDKGRPVVGLSRTPLGSANSMRLRVFYISINVIFILAIITVLIIRAWNKRPTSDR
jgi:hypothetical protein